MAKKKEKHVNYRLIDASTRETPVDIPDPYDLLNTLVNEHHHPLSGANIGLMWRFGLKPDKDGHIELGKAAKVSDKQKELAEYDFVITLNSEFWLSRETSDAQRLALLDHELCHCAVQLDADGEEVFDDRGRRCYRIRKHDVEEFRDVVDRHGCYKSDLEEFAKTLANSKQPGLFKLAANQ